MDNKQQPEQMEEIKDENKLSKNELMEMFLNELHTNKNFRDFFSKKRKIKSGGNKKYVTKAKAKRLRKLQKQARKVNR